jgi:soluble lytic murein transglycosylase
LTPRQYRQAALASAALLLCAVAAEAAPKPAGPVPLPRPRPVAAKPQASPSVAAKPTAITPAAKPQAATVATANPATAPVAAKPAPAKSTVPLAVAPTTTTGSDDLAAVRKAIDLIKKDKMTDAADVGRSAADPVARKLIEWAILRAEDDEFNFDRYAAFIAANPSWPHMAMFRRKAEAALWQDKLSENTVRAFFNGSKPTTAKGRLALARAAIAQGDRTLAAQYVREAWRNDALGADIETQVLDSFGPLLNGGDHKARMERRLYAEDSDAGMRAANRLGGVQVAIAKARKAVSDKSSNAKALLDAVPEDARRDAGYMFSKIQWLRRNDKFAEAAQLMLAAPVDPAVIIDTEEWWTERRLLARKLLDTGEVQLAYRVASEGATPTKQNSKVDQLFTAGWIALRYAKDPAAANQYFAQIAQVDTHPTSLARGAYWQGRTAEALGRHDEARAHYSKGAQYPAAYYGHLARAKIGGDISLPPAPGPAPDARNTLARLELVRAVEILYAIDERDLVVSIAADLADRPTDPGALAMLAEVATRNQDARTLLMIGKGAMARGLPFEAHAFPTVGLPRYTPIGPQVDPAVAYSIARQESAFNPKAVSSANALGLMQVLPGTAKMVAKKNGVAFDQKRLLSDPVYNVQIGAAELGSALESYRGSYILTFASYNAGPGRVREWIGRYGDPRDPGVDPIDWVERIPFSETRNYVQRILENMQVYRVRFGGSRGLMIEADLRRGSSSN